VKIVITKKFVTVTDQNGNKIGEAYLNPDGSFTLQLNHSESSKKVQESIKGGNYPFGISTRSVSPS
jgi:hypothetical protein